MRLLIVEDEIAHANFLRRGLTEEGFAVDVANDGVTGLRLATQVAYDLIVLDGMLPGLDGLKLLESLREQGHSTLVLMLTARVRVDDRVRGLRSGADDYLIKPYAFSELVARIHGLLRRAAGSGSPDASGVLTIADLELDPLARKASRAGKRLDLTVKEFNLLMLLLRRQGEAVSRTEIAERVWDMHFNSGTNAIDVIVTRLRAKIDTPFDKPLLHTVRGLGYVLEERV